MRPVRFVALSEDGHALVLTDEVGRLLALPIDERVSAALRPDRGGAQGKALTALAEATAVLSPRDIQARIRSGESAEDVARVAGVPVDRVLRYAGPVLQERAMLAQHARRTKLKTSDRGATLAEVVDGRLSQHGIDAEKISWDASRREDGTWRIIASWPSGKATAQAMWELDKARQIVAPFDDMAQYLCADRIGQPGLDGAERSGHGHGLASPARGESSRGELGRGHDPLRHGSDPARRDPRQPRPTNDPIRTGRDALLASLDRPLLPGRGSDTGGVGTTPARPAASAKPETPGRTGRGAAALIGPASGTAFDEPGDPVKEVPAVPSLAVLRPRRTALSSEQTSDKPRKRLPSWDDVLFGSGPARESG